MARCGDGLATGTDLVGAAERAARQALEPLRGPADLLCVFVCGTETEEVVLAGERAMAFAEGAATIGCTATGVLGQGGAVESRGAVSVWAARLPGVSISPFQLDTVLEDDYLTVMGMVEPDAGDRVALLLADPFAFPAQAFLRHSEAALGGLPVVGALAGGMQGRESVRLFFRGEVVESGAVGLVLGGSGVLGATVSQGCSPIGPAMVVTEAQGNVVSGLAGSPATTKLEELLEKLPGPQQDLAAKGLQLGVAMDEYAERHNFGDFLVRGVVDADPGTGELTIADVVEVGQTVRFHVRDAATAEQDLRKRLRDFAEGRQERTAGGLLFTCNGRGSDMFSSAEHDLRQVREELGVTAVGGCFATGEIGPVAGRNHLHGYTACLLAFGD